jgi:hypothetical protein
VITKTRRPDTFWRPCLQLGIEGYFRGRNAGGWIMLPDTYWTGVSRMDEFDTWKLPSGLEVGQVRVQPAGWLAGWRRGCCHCRGC